MKVIDPERSLMDGAQIYPKGVEFEADERLMQLISKQSDTFAEVPEQSEPTEPTPDPEPAPEPSQEPVPETVEDAKSETEVEPELEPESNDGPQTAMSAMYSGGGWYEMSDGSNLRRKDLAPDTVIVEPTE